MNACVTHADDKRRLAYLTFKTEAKLVMVLVCFENSIYEHEMVMFFPKLKLKIVNIDKCHTEDTNEG